MRHPIKRGVFKPLLAAFGASRAKSYVDVRDAEIEVVFGRSRHVIPRSHIRAAKRGEWPLIGGIGWRVGPDTLGLIGALDGVIEFELTEPHEHRLLLVPIGYSKLCVSLEDPDALLEDLQATAA